RRGSRPTSSRWWIGILRGGGGRHATASWGLAGGTSSWRASTRGLLGGEKGEPHGGVGREGRGAATKGCDGRVAGVARRVQPPRAAGDPLGLEGGGGRRPAAPAVPPGPGPGRDAAHGRGAARWPTGDHGETLRRSDPGNGRRGRPVGQHAAGAPAA